METILLLAPIAIKLFANCQDKDSKAQAEFIKQHPLRARAQLSRTLRREEGLSGAALRQRVSEATRELDEATVEEVEEVLQSVKEVAGI